MVRYANTADIPRIVSLAREEHSKSKWRDLPFDERHVARLCADFIGGIGRTLLVSPGGYLAGVVQPMGFSPALGAMEYAWFATDGSGLALLVAFEDWAVRMNAKAVIVHDYLGDGRLGEVLSKRRSYGWMGSALFKILET